ncbi:restriction endonuclease subunit S [Streptomyces sp. SMS_SU21]|uniref:restriction endonuclease subunit S n=1 Tax=Streptomyces sp. SMS_SU21 TaxID=2069440 RepID=UPI000C88A682|nr:restriction endonuclease subunit S [Streptomyces sp. SMS_SU21]MCA2201712.1 restriction endonuclease subunit S [Streptomyces sp. SMS_SU21]
MTETRLAPWLSASRWPTAPIRLVTRLGSGHTPSRSKPEYWENCSIPWITLADVWQLRDGQTTVITETKEMVSPLGLANSAAVKHPAGTVILSRTASVGFSAIMGRDMATSQDFATWTCGPKLDPRYLLHSLRGMAPDLKRVATGSTHKTIYMPDIEQLRVPLPPLEEQRRIADFLDAETSRIDSLVGTLQRERELLAERRTAGVVAAVSGSSHTGRARRDSTLPWLQSVPRTWQEVRVGLLAQMGSGHTPSRSHPEWWVDCYIPWITTGEVKQVRDDRLEDLHTTREKISDLGLANSAAELHPKGTVFLCRTASAGYSGVMGLDMATSQDFVTWTCGPRLLPHFLLWCLRAMRPDLLGRLAMGSTHKTIYVPDLQMLRIPLPPLEEQAQIVHTIRRQNGRVDTLTDKVQRQQELLRERRQALITAAVIGQFDVSTASGRNVTEGSGV